MTGRVIVYWYSHPDSAAPSVAVAVRGKDVQVATASSPSGLKRKIKRLTARFYEPETVEEHAWFLEDRLALKPMKRTRRARN